VEAQRHGLCSNHVTICVVEEGRVHGGEVAGCAMTSNLPRQTDHNESNDGPHSCTAANDHEKDDDAIEINDASSSCLDRVLVDDGGDLADTGTPSRNYT